MDCKYLLNRINITLHYTTLHFYLCFHFTNQTIIVAKNPTFVFSTYSNSFLKPQNPTNVKRVIRQHYITTKHVLNPLTTPQDSRPEFAVRIYRRRRRMPNFRFATWRAASGRHFYDRSRKLEYDSKIRSPAALFIGESRRFHLFPGLMKYSVSPMLYFKIFREEREQLAKKFGLINLKAFRSCLAGLPFGILMPHGEEEEEESRGAAMLSTN